MITHTPGPWTAKESFISSDRMNIFGAGGENVTFTGMIDHADLCLILAAPQLLEACKTAIGVFRPRDGASEDESRWFYSVIEKCPEVRALRAAIAAATGETP